MPIFAADAGPEPWWLTVLNAVPQLLTAVGAVAAFIQSRYNGSAAARAEQRAAKADIRTEAIHAELAENTKITVDAVRKVEVVEKQTNGNLHLLVQNVADNTEAIKHLVASQQRIEKTQEQMTTRLDRIDPPRTPDYAIEESDAGQI